MEPAPCPLRIPEDMGAAFSMGLMGGAVWHMAKGSKGAQKGFKLRSGMHAVKTKAPGMGGAFAVWGGLFTSFDCVLSTVRQSEGPWNSIIAGGMTGAILAARGGIGPMLTSGAVGAGLLGLIEGVNILMINSAGTPGLDPEEELRRHKEEDARRLQIWRIKKLRQERERLDSLVKENPEDDLAARRAGFVDKELAQIMTPKAQDEITAALANLDVSKSFLRAAKEYFFGAPVVNEHAASAPLREQWIAEQRDRMYLTEFAQGFQPDLYELMEEDLW